MLLPRPRFGTARLAALMALKISRRLLKMPCLQNLVSSGRSWAIFYPLGGAQFLDLDSIGGQPLDNGPPRIL
jgi:hypothetical protein